MTSCLRALTFIVASGLLIPAARSQPASTPSTPDPPSRTYVYKQVPGCEMKADVYRLPGEDVRPVVLWIHGGALIFSHRGSVKEHQLERYLRAGFVVVSIDYRLAPETKLPAIIDDLQDAYRWVREQGPRLFQIDADRIAVVGNSGGAYLALMAGASVQPRPRAVISFYGYGDISGPWTTRPDPHYVKLDPIAKNEAYAAIGSKTLSESPTFPRVLFYNYCRQHGLWPKEVGGADPEREPERLARFCPVRHVTSDFPPTLLLHGDKDTDVPFEESQRMAAALEREHVPHQLITMKNYDHLSTSIRTDGRQRARRLR